MDQVVTEDQVSMVMDDEEILDAGSESDESDSPSHRFEYFVTKGFSEIDQSSFEGSIIRTSISQNLPTVKRARIVAIHKNLNVSRSWEIRAHSFRVSMKAVADKCGGDSNTHYAWYGASRDEICEIITHGFSWRGAADKHGVCFSPSKHLLDSVMSSPVDENGLRHLLLCRLILGKQEVVTGDSGQFHPSSSEFDSGVDDIAAPKKFIIWNTRLNYSILLCYIVSIDAPCLTGSNGVTDAKIIKPKSTWVRFPTLIALLSRFLDQLKMASIRRQYADFQEKRITRQQLIQRVKEIAGNQLLTVVLNMYTNKETQASSSKREDMMLIRNLNSTAKR